MYLHERVLECLLSSTCMHTHPVSPYIRAGVWCQVAYLPRVSGAGTLDLVILQAIGTPQRSSSGQSSGQQPSQQAAQSTGVDFLNLSDQPDSQDLAKQMGGLKPFGQQQTSTFSKEHDSWATFE